MEEAVRGGRAGWGTAVALSVAVLAFSAFDALALVFLPMSLLLVALPGQRRLVWVLAGALLFLVALGLSAGSFAVLSQGWGLTLGALFLVVTLVRPEWSVIARALTAVGSTVGMATIAVVSSGQLAGFERLVRDHLETVSSATIGDLQTRIPDSEWLAELQAAAQQVSEFQVELFPALLALQSVAALALASWWVRRLGRSDSGAFEVAPLAEFSFNDQLIWVLIAGVILLLLPIGGGVDRIATNVLVFMGALYALRGFGVFIYLAIASRSIATMVLGAIAFIFLYPVALTAALLMGVGDTWLDVRRRAETANPT